MDTNSPLKLSVKDSAQAAMELEEVTHLLSVSVEPVTAKESR